MKLENRKGVSFTMGHVMGLMLGILFLMFMGVFVASGSSPVKNSLMEGMGLIEEQVDRTVDVREPQTMSDLAMLSLHRATDEACKNKERDSDNKNGIVAFQNMEPDSREQGDIAEIENDQWNKWGAKDQTGYPGLKDSYLGKFPECTGASSTGAREGANLRPGTELGMDMEGVYSRENFKIPEDANPITIDTSASGANWLNDHFTVAAQKPLELAIKPKDQCDNYRGSHANFAVYFEDDVANKRSNSWVKDNDNLNNNGIYCTQGDNEHISDNKYINEGNRQVILCPGDKGYVKVNKIPDDSSSKPPTTDGEAGKNGLTNLLSGFNYYPHIVITETTQKKCGEAETGQKPKIVNVESETRGSPEKYYVKFGMKNRRLSEKKLKAKIYSGDTKLKELDGKNVEPDSTKTEEDVSLPKRKEGDGSLNCEEGVDIELHSKDPGGDSFEKVNQHHIPENSVIPCNPAPDP